MSSAGNGRLSAGTILGIGAGIATALAVAFIADHTGYPITSQILLVTVASFGGAVLGGLILLHPKRTSERRAADRQVRAPTAAELREMANIGCWEWDVRADVFTWNAGMYAIYGLSPETFTPTKRSMLDLVAPQDVQSVLDTWWKDNDGPPVGMVECRVVRPDGEYRHVRYVWHTVDAETDSPTVFGMAQDITALRIGERASRHDDAHLRGMVECSADYIWDYHPAEPGLPLANTLRLEKFGSVEARGAGKPSVDGDSDYDFAPLARVIEERAKFRDIVVPIVDGNGEPRWINLSGHPQFDGEGLYYGYRGVGADVTEAIRERDYEEGRRQQGAVGRLASGLAHEINNLLQPILIYSAFGADEAKQHEKLRLYFTRITRAAERATFIVKNVLSFARHTPPSHEDLNVIGVVRETVDLMSGAVGARTMIELSAEDDVMFARVERTGLAQIVTNLIANAADAMTSGGKIVVRVEQALVSGETSKSAGVAPGRYCRVSVEDAGPGISADHLSKVFDPFFTTKPQGKGTGLGLAVVSGIAKSWGGGATADSVIGKGSRFSVYLPATERELQAAQ